MTLDNRLFVAAVIAMVSGTAMLLNAIGYFDPLPESKPDVDSVASATPPTSYSSTSRHATTYEPTRHSEPAPGNASANTYHTKERYYQDSKGAVISESDAEAKLFEIRCNILRMPTGAKRAYYEGVLESLEKEWERIKRQGPINP